MRVDAHADVGRMEIQDESSARVVHTHKLLEP
jgi:hypothetical protein